MLGTSVCYLCYISYSWLYSLKWLFSTMVGKEALLTHEPLAGQLFQPDHHQLHLAGCRILLSIREVVRVEKRHIDVLWSLQMLQQGWTHRVSGAVVWQGRPALIRQLMFMGCTAYGGSLRCLLSSCSSPVLSPSWLHAEVISMLWDKKWAEWSSVS